MKILLIAQHSPFVRLFELPFKSLTEKGHRIHIGINCLDMKKDGFDNSVVERLTKENSAITADNAPGRGDFWKKPVTALRLIVDYCRYFHPMYAKAFKLKERIALHFPRPFQKALALLSGSGKKYSRLESFIRFLVALDKRIPYGKAIERYIKRHAPDLIILTPLIDFGSPQVDYVKCARALGIPCVLSVASWDNLTNKGLIRIIPDALLVWNEIQKNEAMTLHFVEQEKVIVTGAQCFDIWFEKKPSVDRQAFFGKIGLAPNNVLLLYVGSSSFIAEKEVAFVEQWLRQVRSSSNPLIRDAAVLLRPHPLNARQWENTDFSEFSNVTIWPKNGALPFDPESRTSYFDSLFHSTAVIGINTSAFIEAGIVGKPIYTFISKDFEGTQEGTIHFHYLVDGGLLRVGRDFDEHLAQLAADLVDPAPVQAKIKAFITSFVRPHGFDKPCAPIYTYCIEQLLARKKTAEISRTK
jgi:hypothetical protein